MNLDEFFRRMDAYRGRVPLSELHTLMERLAVSSHDLGSSVVFGEGRYQRNLIRRTSTYEAFVLCWEPGQRSPIHDHAQSTCGVRVVQGRATETRYEFDQNHLLHPVETTEAIEGSTTGSQDADIHEISNEHDERLITLHVYSPPIGAMTSYSMNDQARTARCEVTAAPTLHPVG